MRSVKDELAAMLCRKINEKTMAILLDKDLSDYERYIKTFRHIQEWDDSVAECFDDWRRTTFHGRMISLHRHGLLTGKHMAHLSEGLRDLLRWSETQWERKA